MVRDRKAHGLRARLREKVIAIWNETLRELELSGAPFSQRVAQPPSDEPHPGGWHEKQMHEARNLCETITMACRRWRPPEDTEERRQI